MKTLTLTLLFFSLLASSCEKAKISLKNETDIVGSYEWAYSFSSDNSSESFQTISNKYGIVLKENGKAKLYKDGEEVMSGFVAEIGDNNDGTSILRLVLNNKDVYLTFTGSALEYDSYPISNHTNCFVKL